MKHKWKLELKDVYWYGGSSSRTGRTNARQPRNLDERSIEMNLVHQPTGIEVKGSVPEGNYTRKELTKLKDELYQRLFIELEKKIATTYRISGRVIDINHPQSTS